MEAPLCSHSTVFFSRPPLPFTAARWWCSSREKRKTTDTKNQHSAEHERRFRALSALSQDRPSPTPFPFLIQTHRRGPLAPIPAQNIVNGALSRAALSPPPVSLALAPRPARAELHSLAAERTPANFGCARLGRSFFTETTFSDVCGYQKISLALIVSQHSW